MIKNDRQYQATKFQADKFAVALRQAEEREYPDPLLAKLERDALRSQLGDLEAELAEYDRLRSGQVKEILVDAVDRIPQALISARIAAGLSQKELADRLGLKEQQIQRYEATDYASAGLSRILEVMRAMGGGIRLTMTVPAAVPSGGAFLKRLAKAGVIPGGIWERVPRYDLDMNAAWKLVEAMRKSPFAWVETVSFEEWQYCRVVFSGVDYAIAEGDRVLGIVKRREKVLAESMHLAICQAFLEACKPEASE